MQQTDDLRIVGTEELVPPNILLQQVAISDKASEIVATGRESIHNILTGKDDRLLVIVGPCSIHDPKSALEYAERLTRIRDELKDDLYIVMRVYFEKPRTTVGWKGLINDPDLDQSFQIQKGLTMARALLRDINEMGMPVGSEYLDLITPQYTGDLISWGAIGARTTESQCHRELASGLSCAVGFKNGTSGNLQIAVDAIGASNNPHIFLSVTKEGRTAIFNSAGNPDSHIILRGGSRGVNYQPEQVREAEEALAKADLPEKVMIDFSHANSEKQHQKQIDVGKNVGDQIAAGSSSIFGVMIESHLVAGNQKVEPGKQLTYGQSITDACLAMDDTEDVLRGLSKAVRDRRAA
ncbi:MAG: 3-deoxy-7-phosphoheptulonate synthase [Proteobacteria bacterium]|jgi:3-deoxy-7-phosphoheptulonate synthase|nr:3-deoxy-7-phosphoheptulonate synthase [Pseudomonadota bacterium]